MSNIIVYKGDGVDATFARNATSEIQRAAQRLGHVFAGAADPTSTFTPHQDDIVIYIASGEQEQTVNDLEALQNLHAHTAVININMPGDDQSDYRYAKEILSETGPCRALDMRTTAPATAAEWKHFVEDVAQKAANRHHV